MHDRITDEALRIMAADYGSEGYYASLVGPGAAHQLARALTELQERRAWEAGHIAAFGDLIFNGAESLLSRAAEALEPFARVGKSLSAFEKMTNSPASEASSDFRRAAAVHAEIMERGKIEP
jgi:hypothetical protein